MGQGRGEEEEEEEEEEEVRALLLALFPQLPFALSPLLVFSFSSVDFLETVSFSLYLSVCLSLKNKKKK